MGRVDWVVSAMWSCWVASFGLRQFTDPAILRSRQCRRRSFGQESGPDVAWMPITDMAPNEVRLAWVSSRRTPLIAEFVVLAETAVRDGQTNPTT